MSSRLSAQICQIRAPEKLPDRLILSGVIGTSTDSPLSEQFVIAYLLEVSRPWLPASQVLPSIVKTLEEEHTKLHPKEGLDDQFEAVLRSVNQRLNTVSESGETDWIGNLNGLILLLGKEEIHFSQTGRCPTYLLQNNRIRQITDDTTEKDPHPLKTFSNLASGHLLPGDQILVANQELYNEISLDAMRRILNSSTPYNSCLAIAKEMKKDNNAKISALITSIIPLADLKLEPTIVDMEEVLESNAKKMYRRLLPALNAAKKGSEELGKAGLKAAQELGKAGMQAAAQAQQVTKEKVIPGATSLIAKGKGKLVQSPIEEPTTSAMVEIISPDGKAKAEPPVERPVGSVVPASEFAVEYGEEESNIPAPIPDIAKHFLKEQLPQILKKALASFSVWIQVPKNKKITALGIAGVLVLSVVWGAVAQRNQPSTNQSVGQNVVLLKEIEAAIPKVAAAIQVEQEIEASKLLEEAFTKLGKVTNPTAQQQEDMATLWSQLTTQSDTITKTTRFATVGATYSMPGNANNFFASLPYFYGLEKNGNGLLRTGSGTLAETEQKIPLPDANELILSMTPSSETDTAGYILTKQAKVYRISQNSSTTLLMSIAPQSGDFATGDAIASYSGNIYILDGKSGLLWRYINSGTSYSKGTMIVDVNKINLRDSISLGIDGSIYILKQDGSVMKLTSSKADPNFTIQNLPYLSQKLIRPLQIIAEEGFSSFYVLDGGTTSSEFSTAKILEFNKNGGFIRQYAFPSNFNDVRSFDINPKENKVWVLNGTTVSEFSL